MNRRQFLKSLVALPLTPFVPFDAGNVPGAGVLGLGDVSDEEIKRLMAKFKESLADVRPIWIPVEDGPVRFVPLRGER